MYKNWKPVTDRRCEEEANRFATENRYTRFTVLGYKIDWISTAVGFGPAVTYEVQFQRN
jgi:hypothetical protein